MIYIVLFDLLVDIDIIFVKDLRILKGFDNRRPHSVREERVFVWGLETTNERVDFFSFTVDPIQETEIAVGYLNSASFIDSPIEGELDSFDEMEGDCVFQADELEAYI